MHWWGEEKMDSDRNQEARLLARSTHLLVRSTRLKLQVRVGLAEGFQLAHDIGDSGALIGLRLEHLRKEGAERLGDVARKEDLLIIDIVDQLLQGFHTHKWRST